MYDTVLAAVDFSKDTGIIIEKALKVADNDKSKIHLVSVLEPIAPAYSMDIYKVNVDGVQQEALELTNRRLHDIGKSVGIAMENLHPRLGPSADEIRSVADEINADAIVLGSHGHSGWKTTLGSTTNKVLHHVDCDILVVHTKAD